MQQSTEIRDMYIRLCEASARGDVGTIEQLFSRQAGAMAIGTDPKEWWDSSDRVLQAWKAQIEALGGSMPIVAGDPQAYQEGTVGWVADQPKFRLPDGDVPFRMTCVFHQEDGAWKLVQLHGSLGVANEEALGGELPI